MEPIRILHFADAHVGVENYGRLDAETGLHTRLQDFANSLTFMVDTALARGVDAVLFAGDAYKHSAPTPTHEGKFAEQMKRFADAGIPVVMVTGNHDIPAAFGRASSLGIFETLGGKQAFYVAERPELLRIETTRGAAQIACFPWPTRHILLTKDEYKHLNDEQITRAIQEKCERRLEKFARDLDPALPSVLLAHLAAADAVYSGSERSTIIGSDPVILQSILRNPAFDYVALGHIHRHQNLNPHGQPPVVYSGSIERIDFGEAREEKGFCLVSLQKGAAAYEFVPTPARPFVKIEVDAREQEFPTDAIVKAIATHPTANAVVRVLYLLNDAQKKLVDMPLIYAALKDAFLVAGVTGRSEEAHSQRPRIPEGLSLQDAFAKYVEFMPECQDKKAALLEYAGRLFQELDAQE